MQTERVEVLYEFDGKADNLAKECPDVNEEPVPVPYQAYTEHYPVLDCVRLFTNVKITYTTDDFGRHYYHFLRKDALCRSGALLVMKIGDLVHINNALIAFSDLCNVREVQEITNPATNKQVPVTSLRDLPNMEFLTAGDLECKTDLGKSFRLKDTDMKLFLLVHSFFNSERFKKDEPKSETVIEKVSNKQAEPKKRGILERMMCTIS
jgi:hypothetical protein